MRRLMWKIKLWHLRQMLAEARSMIRIHWNIARNRLDDHMRKEPKP